VRIGVSTFLGIVFIVFSAALLFPEIKSLLQTGSFAWQVTRGRVATALMWMIIGSGIALLVFDVIPWPSIYNPSVLNESSNNPTNRPRATLADLMSRRTFEGLAIYLSDLQGNETALGEKVFINCEFHGPGVLLLRGSGELRSNHFYANRATHSVADIADALFWDSRPYVVGAFDMKDSVIRDSHFFKIGFAITPKDRERFISEFIKSDDR
jgi:hypothetical protein